MNSKKPVLLHTRLLWKETSDILIHGQEHFRSSLPKLPADTRKKQVNDKLGIFLCRIACVFVSTSCTGGINFDKAEADI